VLWIDKLKGTHSKKVCTGLVVFSILLVGIMPKPTLWVNLFVNKLGLLSTVWELFMIGLSCMAKELFTIGLSCMAMECIKIGFLCMVIEVFTIGLRCMALKLNLIGLSCMEMYAIKIGLAGMGCFFNLGVLYGILTAKGKGKIRNVMGLDGMTMAWSVALVVPIQLGKLNCLIFQKVPHLWSTVIGCICVDRQCEICPM